MASQEALPPVWVRDESSRIWGPLSLATLEMMVDHGIVGQPFEYSTDGVAFQAAPEDLLTGSGAALVPAAFAPPVLTATSSAPTGSSAMKAIGNVSRAEQAARGPGGLPPKAGGGTAPGQRASGAPLPPKVGIPATGPASAQRAAPPPRVTPPSATPGPRAPAPPVAKAASSPPGQSAPPPVPKASPGQPSPPAANRVPRATTSKPAIAPPAPGQDGGMNLDAMLKDISEFKHKLPSEVLAEARKAAGLPDLHSGRGPASAAAPDQPTLLPGRSTPRPPGGDLGPPALLSDCGRGRRRHAHAGRGRRRGASLVQTGHTTGGPELVAEPGSLSGRAPRDHRCGPSGGRGAVGRGPGLVSLCQRAGQPVGHLSAHPTARAGDPPARPAHRQRALRLRSRATGPGLGVSARQSLGDPGRCG